MSIAWTSQASDARRRSQVLPPQPGTGGFCVCRGRPLFTLHSSRLAGALALVFQSQDGEDPGVLPGRIFVRSSYSRAPVSGGDFSTLLPVLGPLLGLQHRQACSALGCPWPFWPEDGCPCGRLVAQGHHPRKTPKGYTSREMRPKLCYLPPSW